MNYIITGDTYNGKYIEQNPEGIVVLSADELSKTSIRFALADKLYIPSETALSIVLERMQDPASYNSILKLKDKYLCRELMKPMYPDFFFQKCCFEDLRSMKIPVGRYVVKPQKGFFGTGVRIVDQFTNMELLAEDIRSDIASKSRYFPETILSKEDFLIEQCIEGEEYAVDMFYDSNGKPCIMNIYHHPDPVVTEYSHLMYYSNAELFRRYLSEFIVLFNELGNHIDLKNFPIHAEFKRQNGVFLPIEFNPMRYGGFGLADLGALSYKMQAISSYFDDLLPDWDKIWENRKNMNYAFILAYNGKDIDILDQKPDHHRFRDYLRESTELMDYRKLDYQKNPVFAIAYVKTDSYDALLKLLHTEFNDFFV